MKKQFIFCFVVFVLVSGSMFNSFDIIIMAQVPVRTPDTSPLDPLKAREVPTLPPIVSPLPPTKGPAEEILQLEIRDGLKRFLLADLFAMHGDYEKAFEIVDYTKPVTVLDKKLAVEEDPELIRLLEYQRQKIKGIIPTPVPTLLETVKRRADNEYKNILYYKKHKKPEEALQSALIALESYQQIENIAGQLRVRYQLALLYKELGDKTEAVRQAREFMKLEQELEFIKKYEEMQELLKE